MPPPPHQALPTFRGHQLPHGDKLCCSAAPAGKGSLASLEDLLWCLMAHLPHANKTNPQPTESHLLCAGHTMVTCQPAIHLLTPYQLKTYVWFLGVEMGLHNGAKQTQPPALGHTH